MPHRRVLEGVVVSDKPDKTVIVLVERKTRHPLYERIIKTTKKYHAHDEANAVRAGQRVRIQECRPLSKLKRWEVIEVVGTSADITPDMAADVAAAARLDATVEAE